MGPSTCQFFRTYVSGTTPVLQINHLHTPKVSHRDSFWNRGTTKFGKARKTFYGKKNTPFDLFRGWSRFIIRLAPWVGMMPWLRTRMGTWSGKMELSCPLGTTCCILQEKLPRKLYNKSIIDQACLVKMASFFFCKVMDLDFFSVHKHKHKKRTWPISSRPSWPHTWSIRKPS